jgi:riboflavin biosynthesis pyrimidine reductase
VLFSGGKICSDTGGFLKITSGEQDIWSHTNLRARHDAILVGIGTIEADNPQLNTRFAQIETFSQLEGLNRKLQYEKNSIQPYKIILDPHFRISADARVVSGRDAGRSIVISNADSLGKNMNKKVVLSERGVRVITLPQINGHFDWNAMWKELLTPREGFSGLTSILVEGGQRTWDSFSSARLIDEEVILRGR